jgi:hypothetical protein
LNKIINGVIIGVLAIIIIGVIVSSTTNDTSNNIKVPTDSEVINKSENTPITDTISNKIIDTTQKSGPFQINKSEYRLGEYILLHVEGLQIYDKGEIGFIRAINSTHYTPYKFIPFNGAIKSNFNQIIDVELGVSNICNAEDIIGDWRVWFKGTEYTSIDFKFNNETLIGETKFSETVC